MSTTTKNVKLLGARVVARWVKEEEKTIGGIYLPETAKEKPQIAEIIEIGNDGFDRNGNPIKIEVKAGDKVLVDKYAGTEVKIDGEEFIIVNAAEILAVVS